MTFSLSRKKIVGQRFSIYVHNASACRRRSMSDSSLVCWPRMKMLTLMIGGMGKLIFRGKKHRLETRVNNFFSSVPELISLMMMKMSFLLMTLIFPNCSSSLTHSLCTLFFAPCGVSGALAVSNRTVDEASFVYEYQFLFFGKRLHREEKKKATSISLSHLSSVLLVACNRGNSAFRKHTSEEEEEERARSKACKTEHAIKCQRKFIISQIPSCIYIY